MNSIGRVASRILEMKVNCTTYWLATNSVMESTKAGESRYMCVANVHMVMEAYDDQEFRQLVNRADMVTSDGMPLIWVLRWQGHRLKEGSQAIFMGFWLLIIHFGHGLPHSRPCRIFCIRFCIFFENHFTIITGLLKRTSRDSKSKKE